MIESTRLKPLLGGRRNGGGVSHVSLCTQGGETGFAPQPHASGSNNHTHTHIHITLTRWEGRQACEGAGRGHSREGAFFLHIRRSSSGPHTTHSGGYLHIGVVVAPPRQVLWGSLTWAQTGAGLMRLPRRTQLPAGLLSWLRRGRKWGTPLPHGCGDACEGASGVEVIGKTPQWQCWVHPSHHREARPLPEEGCRVLADPWQQSLARAHPWPGQQHFPSQREAVPQQRMTPHLRRPPATTEDPSPGDPPLEGVPQPHVETAKELHAPAARVSCGCRSAGTLGAGFQAPLAVLVAVLQGVPVLVGEPQEEERESAGRETLRMV